jgi:Rap guanine nucleotide exchange factor 1
VELTDESNPLEHLDITKYLVIKKPDEEGPDVRGGHPDALIIHATKANKNGEISGSYGNKYEDGCLLGCCFM